MKNLIKKYLWVLAQHSKVLLIVLILFCTNAFADETNPVQQDKSDLDINLYITNFVEQTLTTYADISNGIWNASTAETDRIYLYDIKDNVSGCIVQLENNGAYAGYIQICIIDNIPRLHSFSFEGNCELYKLLTSGGYNIDDLVYLGKSYYLIQDTEDFFTDPYSGDVVSNTQVLQKSAEVKIAAKYNYKTAEMNIAPGTTMVSGFTTDSDTADFRLVAMSDFNTLVITGDHASQVSNHCSPTAGTNIIKYYFRCRNKKSLAYGYSDKMIFERMYIAMNTNHVNSVGYSKDDTGGTYWDITVSFGYNGLKKYCKNQGLEPTIYGRKVLGITYNNLKSIIDQDCPVMLTLKNFQNNSGETSYHSVVMFGYYNGLAAISTGWDKKIHYYSYNNALTVSEYYYIGWK